MRSRLDNEDDAHHPHCQDATASWPPGNRYGSLGKRSGSTARRFDSVDRIVHADTAIVGLAKPVGIAA